MIFSKQDYNLYLKEDFKAIFKKEYPSGWGGRFWTNVKYRILTFAGTDNARSYMLCKALRRYEYALNCLPNNLFYNFYKSLCKYRYHRIGIKCNVSIIPNTVGYGLQIQHIKGGGCVIVAHSVGNYFSIRQYTTVGKANGDACPRIGNNVTLGANVTIIGDITIGDNCIIGAGAVVVKDIPADSIVVGNPGRVISKRIPNKRY